MCPPNESNAMPIVAVQIKCWDHVNLSGIVVMFSIFIYYYARN